MCDLLRWNVRFYGLAYKLPNISTSDLDSLINGLKTDDLNSTQTSLLQNRTQDLASIPIPSANLSALIFANGSAVTHSSGIQLNTADEVGGFDQLVAVPDLGGNSSSVRVIETGITNVTGPRNGTVILVPSSGISVVSDIDDVTRITKVYVPNQGLYNSFVQPYTLPGAAFHYDTTTPVELTRTYVDYLFSNFPLGSLEMRPINITEPSQILEARTRQNSLLKLFQTFPQRKFVLVGDTSSSTLLSAYPQIAQQNTSDFKNINNNTWFFYRTADDLFNLDIAGGQCRNDSIPQNVIFGEQGGVLGDNGAGIPMAIGDAHYVAAAVGATVALILVVL
ncbi:hypothetical protein C8Q79DRAFT_1009675 [Trametes meyenii]|nr:hypothetical protein C8Q79DRAFT_1009675 [Trametes meyenii]